MANKGVTLPAEVFSKDEVDRFLGTFSKKSFTGLRNKAMFLIALRCQLRCNEITSLRVSDIDFDRCCITVLKGKGGKRRVVGCDPDTLVQVRKYLDKRPPLGVSWLFVSHKGRRIDNSYLRKLAARHGVKAGIRKRVHVHGFRHTGACFLADAGVDVRIIQKQLGHSSLAVTDRYLDHLGAGAVLEALQEIRWD